MNPKEIEERNLTVNSDGKVLDEYGNEYHNENGQVAYVSYDYIKQVVDSELIRSYSELFDELVSLYKVPNYIVKEFTLLAEQIEKRKLNNG